MKRRMNGGQALVRSLAAQGVAVTFGVPGAGQYEAVDAYFDTDGIRYVSCRNEQPTTHMADGYARASNRPASALVVPGAGLFNACGGISTALRSSSPIIVISGSPEDRLKGASSSLWLEPITKWSARATSPAEVAAKVPEAVRAACSGHPRPVYLEVAAPVLTQEEEVEIAPPATIEPPAGDAAALERAAAMLSDAERPLILAGTGVHRSGASAALAALAERLPAPVATTTAGKGAISDRSPLALGHALRAYAPLVEFAQSRDVVLAVGTQAGPAGLLGVDPERVIRIDLDAGVLDTGVGAADQALAIEADARLALETLIRTGTSRQRGGSHRGHCRAQRRALRQHRAARAAALLHRGAAGRDPGRRNPGVRHEPDGLLQPQLLPRLRARHLLSTRAATWARRCQSPWAPRSRGPTRRWSPAAVTAASCTTSRSWPPRCCTASP